MKKAILSLASYALLAFTLSAQLRADSVLTKITVGAEPVAVAANPATNKIYVSVDGLGQVAVINGQTQTVTGTINVGRNAVAVAVNVLTNRIYASGCNSSACNIWVIDGKTDTIITSIPIASGSFLGIQGLAVNPVTNRVYATDADNEQYIVIDGKTNAIVTLVPVFTQPAGVAVNPRTSRIYIGGGGFPGLLMVFDGDNNAQLARITESSSVEAVATNFRLDRAYGNISGSDAMAVVDGATNQQLTEIPTGRFPAGIDVNLSNNNIYVSNAQGGSVTIIDGNTNQVLQTLPIPASFPDGVAVNLATNLTYVADFGSGQVIVLQPN